jgi:ketosteroid isomerase-like protein
MFKRSIAFLFVGLLLTGVHFVTPSGRADPTEEARTLFEQFVAAQNAHDLDAVGQLLLDSKDFIWITRGTAIWGRDAALQRFKALYQGTWRLEPTTAELKVVHLGNDAVHLYVPVTFMIASAGQTAQPSKFLMNQILVRTAQGWKIASILPILVPAT